MEREPEPQNYPSVVTERLKQDDHEFEASLDYEKSTRPARTYLQNMQTHKQLEKTLRDKGVTASLKG